MKKFLVMLLTIALAIVGMTFAMAEEKSEGVMTYADFVAAELDSKVVIETYIQAKQGWWEENGQGQATFYTQDKEGAYFLYNMPCTQEEYDLLTVGTKIKATGYKAEWAGEVEITDAVYEILEAEPYIAEAFDATALLGTEELINYQNQFVTFKGMTVKAIEYKNGEPGDDIYITFTKDGADYNFCVEAYLTDSTTEVYQAVSALEEGSVVDVDGFLYWYEGVNTHITAVTAAE